MIAPDYNSARKLGYPSVRNFDLTVAAGASKVIALAPLGHQLGFHADAVLNPTAADTFTNVVRVTDPYIDDFIGTVSAGASTTSEAFRVLKFCAAIRANNSLATVGGLVYADKWKNGPLPSGFGAGVPLAYYTYVTRDMNLPHALASFVETKCLRTGMAERSALDYTAGVCESIDWDDVYMISNQELSPIGVGVGRLPWDPIVFWVSNSSSTTQNMTISVETYLEKIPDARSFQFHLGQYPKPTKAGAEVAWWNMQRKLSMSGLVPYGTGADRSGKAYLGIEGERTNGERRRKRLRRPKKPQQPKPEKLEKAANLGKKALKAIATSQPAQRAVMNAAVPLMRAISQMVVPAQRRQAIRNEL